MPLGAGPAALAGRLRLPLLRPSGALRAGGSGSLSMQPVQEADIAHGGHDLPRDQAAADTLVCRHPPDRDGEERHLVGGTRPPSRGQAADGLGREAQDHGGDGAARGGDGAYGAGRDGRRLSRRVCSGGKRGRGAAGKTPFVAAVSTSPEGRPRELKLAPVKGFRKREIARGAKHWLAPGAAVVTDGLGCWSALEEAACSHQAIRTGSGRQAARMASFKWVNTTLGNIKSAITGTYRKLGPDHAGRYLASFAWRYNRRYQLQTMIPRFVHSAARNQPMPYRLLIAG